MNVADNSGKWRFDNNMPIFKQIAGRLKSEIAQGRYAPGEKFPSVRELAMEIGVNPNTVQRAVSYLEESGILESRRGDGRYVSLHSDDMKRISFEITRDVCNKLINVMKDMGLTDEEIIDAVKLTLEERKEV